MVGQGTASTELGGSQQGGAVWEAHRGVKGGVGGGAVGGATGHLGVGGPPTLAGAAPAGGSSGDRTKRPRRKTRAHCYRRQSPRDQRRARAADAACQALSPPPSGLK